MFLPANFLTAGNPTRMSGVGLIEVMVSLIVLTVGMLGMAALQGLGTQFNNRAYYRSQALTQAYDLIDTMRANMGGVGNGDYVQDPMPDHPAGTNCAATVCTTTQMATFDLAEWNNRNANLLPSGSGSVTSASGVLTVQVNWLEDRDDDGVAESQNLTLAAQL